MRNAHTQNTCCVCGSQLPAGPLSGLCPACLLDSSISSVDWSETSPKESGLSLTAGQPWPFGRYQVLAIRACTVSFFDKYLKNQDDHLLDDPAAVYPNIINFQKK